MCIYEYTVTAKFLAIYSHSKLPAVVRKEEHIFQEERNDFSQYIKNWSRFITTYLISKKKGGGLEEKVYRLQVFLQGSLPLFSVSFSAPGRSGIISSSP